MQGIRVLDATVPWASWVIAEFPTAYKTGSSPGLDSARLEVSKARRIYTALHPAVPQDFFSCARACTSRSQRTTLSDPEYLSSGTNRSFFFFFEKVSH